MIADPLRAAISAVVAITCLVCGVVLLLTKQHHLIAVGLLLTAALYLYLAIIRYILYRTERKDR